VEPEPPPQDDGEGRCDQPAGQWAFVARAGCPLAPHDDRRRVALVVVAHHGQHPAEEPEVEVVDVEVDDDVAGGGEEPLAQGGPVVGAPE